MTAHFEIKEWKRVSRELERGFRDNFHTNGRPQREDVAIHVYRLPDNTLKVMPHKVKGAME